MQKITPCLWFAGNADEALTYYTSIFKDAKVIAKSHYGNTGPMPAGSLLTAVVEMLGNQIMLLNAQHNFQFTHAISLSIVCKDQAEVDYYWDALSAEGETEMCGWLKDKFGVSWQIVPSMMGTILSSADKDKTNRVMQAMMQMTKLDIAVLEAAANA